MKKVILSIFLSVSLFAEAPPGFNPIGSIDWDYYWDSINWEFKSCICSTPGNSAATKAGTVFVQSEPIAMIDVTNTPWKFPTFDLEFDDSPDRKQGNSHDNSIETTGSSAFRYTHFIIYPIFGVLNFKQEFVCFEKLNTIGISFLGEIRPDHNNDILAAFLDPIKLLFSNPIAQIACGVDCVTSSFNYPNNMMPWCAGCWGSLATGTGFSDGQDVIVESALLATRMLDRMHYFYALTKTTAARLAFTLGDIPLVDSTCKEVYYPQIVKNQYALQLAYPTVWDAQPIGMTPVIWGNFKNKPWTGDDIVFVLWRERTQCLGAYDCKSTFAELID